MAKNIMSRFKAGSLKRKKANKNRATACSPAIFAVCIEGKKREVDKAISELTEFLNTLEEARGLKCEVLSK